MEQDKKETRYRGLEERLEQKKPVAGSREEDKQKGNLQDRDSGRELPEGVERERKRPLNPSSGRKPPEKRGVAP